MCACECVGFIININDDYVWGGEEIEINVSLMTFQRITQLYLPRGEILCVPKSTFMQLGGGMESNYFSYVSTMNSQLKEFHSVLQQ